MFDDLISLISLWNKKEIKIQNAHIDNLIKNFTFIPLVQISDFEKININFKKSKILTIDQYKSINSNSEMKYFFICLEDTLIILHETLITEFLEKLYTINKNLNIYLLKNAKDIPKDIFQNKYQVFELDENLESFIKCISYETNIKNTKILGLLNNIMQCILGYIIKRSYLKSNRNRFTSSSNIKLKNEIDDDNDLIEIKTIGNGSVFNVSLFYSIINDELIVIKSFNITDDYEKLLNRVNTNLKSICNPFLTKFFGKVLIKSKSRLYHCLAFEYINGQILLGNVEQLQLTEKVAIIVQLIMAIKFLHENNFIFRDLKPNNIMIDQNKTAVLIDFDSMININENHEKHTNDFNDSCFLDSDINIKDSFCCDYYSLAKNMYYIMTGQYPIDNKLTFEKHPEIKSIYEKCTDPIKKYQISIIDIIDEFTSLYSEYFRDETDNINSIFVQKILGKIYFQRRNIKDAIYFLTLAANKNDAEAQNYLGIVYIQKNDYEKAIHFLKLAADQNFADSYTHLGILYIEKKDFDKAKYFLEVGASNDDPLAQFNLGVLYKDFKPDINKAIHYLYLACEKNYAPAQNLMGLIYSNDKYNLKDINKSIHFYELAAKQKFALALYNLGNFYMRGKHVIQDINKAIYYYSLASEQNDSDSQLQLGYIYYDGIKCKKDINKAIYYFELSASQNNLQAQYILGKIYLKGNVVQKNVDKALNYLSCSAYNNNIEAQIYLGNIYYEGKFVRQDIKQSIHYFELAANQGNETAQLNLGIIYNEGNFVRQDIKQSIHYFSLAANQGNATAQLNLGIIYNEGNFVRQDIKQSIHYFSLAANQNEPTSLNNLGLHYIFSNFVPKDINKGIEYLTRSANLNYDEAQTNLGNIYYEGIYVKKDYNKAIKLYKQAANQNNINAQVFLGKIYYEGKIINQNIDQSIYYFTLAANQGNANAQFNLGIIYYNDKIDKTRAITYLTFAANQNFVKAICFLGCIYYEGKYIAKDLNKACHYFTLAADQNYIYGIFGLGLIHYDLGNFDLSLYYLTMAADKDFDMAQYNLGFLLCEGKCVKRDIKKALYYLNLSIKHYNIEAFCLLAHIYYFGFGVSVDKKRAIGYLKYPSEQNMPYAQFLLGVHYYENADIEKALYYFHLAADQKFPDAENNLGLIYSNKSFKLYDIEKALYFYKSAASKRNANAQFNLYILYMEGINVQQNINYAIQYCEQAANQGLAEAQYTLGMFYCLGLHIKQNIEKGINYLKKSSQNKNPKALFSLAYMYHKGKNIKKNIKKAIELYIDASNINNLDSSQFAKNNYGIIKKNGIKDHVKPNLEFAEELFNEAINKTKDKIAMYNCAHIYIFNKFTDKKESIIKLLVDSYLQKFNPSLNLLILYLFMEFKNNYTLIEKELKKCTNASDDLFFVVCQKIQNYGLNNEVNFKRMFKYYETLDFLYDEVIQPVPSNKIYKNLQKTENKNDINESFFEGFGIK